MDTIRWWTRGLKDFYVLGVKRGKFSGGKSMWFFFLIKNEKRLWFKLKSESPWKAKGKVDKTPLSRWIRDSVMRAASWAIPWKSKAGENYTWGRSSHAAKAAQEGRSLPSFTPFPSLLRVRALHLESLWYLTLSPPPLSLAVCSCCDNGRFARKPVAGD